MRWLTLLAGIEVCLLVLPPVSASAAEHAGMQHAGGTASDRAEYPPLPKPGRRIPLEGGYSFIYEFDKTPKIGMTVLKVELFDSSGKKNTSLEIMGEADMPSMRGAHSSGPQLFRVSKKGDYLLPVNVVMPGEWEVRITIMRGGKPILRGAYRFDV